MAQAEEAPRRFGSRIRIDATIRRRCFESSERRRRGQGASRSHAMGVRCAVDGGWVLIKGMERSPGANGAGWLACRRNCGWRSGRGSGWAPSLGRGACWRAGGAGCRCCCDDTSARGCRGDRAVRRRKARRPASRQLPATAMQARFISETACWRNTNHSSRSISWMANAPVSLWTTVYLCESAHKLCPITDTDNAQLNKMGIGEFCQGMHVDALVPENTDIPSQS